MPLSTSNFDTMKKKFAVICVTAALLLSLLGILLTWGFVLPAQYGDTFLGELKHKVSLLEDTPGPRIVLVGGSGVASGVDSALVERELPGYSVVNFGMYAALGTTVMLDLSQPLIRAVKAMLGDSSPTKIPIPAMPELAEAAVWTGDDRDGDCFTYEEQNGILTVIGLTEADGSHRALSLGWKAGGFHRIKRVQRCGRPAGNHNPAQYRDNIRRRVP